MAYKHTISILGESSGRSGMWYHAKCSCRWRSHTSSDYLQVKWDAKIHMREIEADK